MSFIGLCLIIAGCVGSAALIVHIIDCCDTKTHLFEGFPYPYPGPCEIEKAIKITWDEFENYYRLSPDSWNIFTNSADNHVLKKDIIKYYHCYFGKKDYQKLMKFRKAILDQKELKKRLKEQQVQMAETTNFYNAIQKDINTAMAEAQAQQQKGLEGIAQVLENLKKEVNKDE